MQLQYNCNEGGLIPWDGADMLRMLQFFELTYSRVRPYALGLKARPQVPEKFLLLTVRPCWCRGSSPILLLRARYGQDGWYPPAWSHDASGGAGRGADTQS